jgi:5-(carboxyamino)imidazole ribonucleotide synthase
MTEALAPGAVVGILGGGQLGRMLAMAAARLGLVARIYDPDPAAPAGQVAALTVGAWDDAAALATFARGCAVVTYEFENIPPAALDAIESVAPVRPNRRALEISRDRRSEKAFLNGLGLPTAPWAEVTDAATLSTAIDRIGAPAILKTATLGYDGKGQARLSAPADGPAALAAMGGRPAVLEGFVAFEREVSVIAARSLSGAVVAYDPGENLHEGGILRTTDVPAALRPGQVQDAVLLAGRILGALDYVGVMGVELFVTPRGLLVNEIAPRVHNSGHWTQLGCAVDQFEQHLRAIAGWPLGDGRRHADVRMENLIGDDIARVPALASDAGAQLHLYGKAEARPGRKMGHVNRLRPRQG